MRLDHVHLVLGSIGRCRRAGGAARIAFPADLRFANGAPRLDARWDAAREAERPLRTDEGLVTRAIFLLPADGFPDRPDGER